MPKTMKDKVRALLEKIEGDTTNFDAFVKLISLEIGGDVRTQRKYIEYCEDLGIIAADEKDLAILRINREVLNDGS